MSACLYACVFVCMCKETTLFTYSIKKEWFISFDRLFSYSFFGFVLFYSFQCNLVFWVHVTKVALCILCSCQMKIDSLLSFKDGTVFARMQILERIYKLIVFCSFVLTSIGDDVVSSDMEI